MWHAGAKKEIDTRFLLDTLKKPCSEGLNIDTRIILKWGLKIYDWRVPG
jgi:hypothetical protein